MSVKKVLTVLASVGIVACAASSVLALPLITGVVENGTGLDVQGPVVSSASNPSPSGTSAALGDETFQFSDRTHEYTLPRTNAAGVLTTAATGTLQPFPYYLQGLEYIQISNDNRAIADYSLDVTLSAPVTAFLMLDNRNNGPAGNLTSSNTTDPVLGGPLQWVIDDGWARVNSSQMPNGQADYLGSDEGGTVATEDLRIHTAGGNVAGPGNGLNQFYSIYRKNFAAGAHVGFTKQNGIPNGSTYTVAVSATLGPIVPGDVNGSGVSDISDYNIIRTNFFGTGKTRAQGDLNGDGIVNFTDFRRWTLSDPTLGSATIAGLAAGLSGGAVPEPTSLVLLVMGACTAAATARRRR